MVRKPIDKPRRKFRYFRLWALVCFLVVAGCWWIAWFLPRPNGWSQTSLARVSGYAAALFMLVPVAHIIRRQFLQRYVLGIRLTHWMGWHIAASNLAFAFLLIHSFGRADNWFSFTLLALFWFVMLSGIAGFYGQKLLYRQLALMVDREVGRELLHVERERLAEQAVATIRDYSKLSADEIRNWPQLTQRLINNDDSVRKLLGRVPKDVTTAIRDLEDDDLTKDEITASQSVVLQYLNNRLEKLRPDKSTIPPTAQISPEGRHLRDELQQSREADETGVSPGNRQELRVHRYNRLVLDAVWPEEISSSEPIAVPTERFIELTWKKSLVRCFPGYDWFFSVAGLSPVSENDYNRATEIIANLKQRKLVDRLWELVELRRQLDLEHLFHQTGRLWLPVHGPAAWLLVALVIHHIVISALHGGF